MNILLLLIQMSCSFCYNLVMDLVGMIRMRLVLSNEQILISSNVVYILSMQSVLALHFIASQCMACGVMSPLDSRDRTDTSSFIGHNDAASYFVEYKSKRHDICIAFAFMVLLDFLWHSLAMVVSERNRVLVA